MELKITTQKGPNSSELVSVKMTAATHLLQPFPLNISSLDSDKKVMQYLPILALFFLLGCQDVISVIQRGSTMTPTPIPTPETSWIKQIGFETLGTTAAGSDFCTTSAIDKSGNLFCLGNTTGSLGETNAGGTDGIIAKFSPQGSLLWIRQFGSVTTPTATSNDYFWGAATNPDGSIIAFGYTLSSLTETNAGGYDIYVTKLNSNGEVQWIKQFGATSAPLATSHDYPESAAIDELGNIYMGGSTLSSLFEASGGGNDVILIKLDPSGNLLWGKQFGAVTAPGSASSGSDTCLAIYYISTNSIYCGGSTQSSLAEANAGGSDAYVMKFNSAGIVSWIKQLGAVTIGTNASGNHNCSNIDVDSSENIYCSGVASGNLAETSGGLNDIVITKLDSSGNLLWLKQLGSVTLPNGQSSNNDNCLDIKIDNSGNIYCAGQTFSSLGETFGGGTTNPFVLKLSPAGDLLWIKQLGLVTFPSVTHLGTNNCRGLEIFQNQPICLGNTGSNYLETNTSNAGDIFIMKLKSDGSLDVGAP